MSSNINIITAAREMGVPHRQVITNGYFTKDPDRRTEIIRSLAACGVTDLRLSVDAFHQEIIPLDAVRAFAIEAVACGIPVRLQPAWLVSPTDENPYNLKTREILDSFANLGLPESDGNIIFPEGNARTYLAAYFTNTVPENPYIEDPCDVRCLSVSPNGDALGGNVYREDVIEFLERYRPKYKGENL